MTQIALVKIVTSKGEVLPGKPLPEGLPAEEMKSLKTAKAVGKPPTVTTGGDAGADVAKLQEQVVDLAKQLAAAADAAKKAEDDLAAVTAERDQALADLDASKSEVAELKAADAAKKGK